VDGDTPQERHKMNKDEQIAALKEACQRARKFGAMDALRGLVSIQAAVVGEYEVNGTPAEFRSASRIMAETQQMLEAMA
jgi:hypothetical protein